MLRKILPVSLFIMIGLPPVTLGSRPSPRRQVRVRPPQHAAIKDYARLPLAFEPNRGQREPAVKFLSHVGGQTLLLNSTGAILAPAYPDTHSLRMSFAGANSTPEIEGVDPLAGKVNYFIGNDPAKWRTDVPTFAKVRYHRIYQGVDLIYYSGPTSGQLEYDFVLEPGANPDKILIAFSGASGISLDQAGDLVLDCFGSEARLHKPLVYQLVNGRRQEIEGHYYLKNRVEVGFQVAAYDVSKALVIDPTLAFSTYLAGDSADAAESIAVDSGGNVYVAGGTLSTAFPTRNPIQGINASASGYEDAFVTKLNPSGTALIYSTYLGGQFGDHAYAVVVGTSGNVYVAGSTWSPDFPTKNALQPALGGSSTGSGNDVFVSELNAAGNSLVFSTFFGGSGNEFPYTPSSFSMTLDSSGNLCLAGMTSSTDFPTKNPLQAKSGGGVDFFATKMKADGSALIYSTYLGGAEDDVFAGMTVDHSGAVYLTGYVSGFSKSNFPTTTGTLAQGPGQIVVSKINAAGTALEYSTYLPVKSGITTAIAVDPTGSVYLTGVTKAPASFPATPGAYQTSILGSDTAGFLAGLNQSGTAINFATFIGDSVPTAVVLDSTGAVNITGATHSPDFPVTTGAVQIFFNNGVQAIYPSDAFLAKVDASGSTLLYSTYLGGGSDDSATSLALDSSGNAYIAGSTSSSDFPTTAGAFQGSATPPSIFGGHGFIARIDALNAAPVLSSVTPASATAGGTNARLVVNGSNFVLGSVVRWNGSDRPTVFNSFRQLAITIPAADLASGADATITVFNPAPGGGVSNALTLLVTPLSSPSPAPFISDYMPANAFSAEPGLTLTLNGQNFAPNAVVRWNDQDRVTTYVSPGQLTAIIPDSDLTGAGTAMVTVFNPAPGGGVSESVPFVLNPEPQPSVAAPGQTAVSAGVPAGVPGVSLTVSGSGFSRASIASWNGENRPTTYVGPNTLRVALSSADLGAPGLAEIRVWNPQPGGGLSGPLTVPVYVPLPTNDMVYDRFTRMIYASIPSTAVPGRANSIAAIDPASGAVTASVSVGAEPGRLALSDDGQYLYFALTPGNQMSRVDLPSLKPGPMLSLGNNAYGPLMVSDFKVLPRNPDAVAVARQTRFGDSGIAVYENGIKRAQEVATGSGSLAFSGSSSTLYSNASGLGIFNVDSTGVTVRQKPDFTKQILYGAIIYDRGLLFDGSGSVLDAQSGNLAGTFNLAPDLATPYPPQPDAGLGLTFFLVPPQIGNGRIRAFDQRTFRPAGVEDVVAPQTGGLDSLLRWGTNGVAFRGADRIYSFRSALAVPPAADGQTPALTALNTGSAVAGGGNLVLTVVGTGLVRGSVARWNAAERETEHVDDTRLSVYIPAADLAAVGQAAVDVVSPAGLVSNALNFSTLPMPPSGFEPHPRGPVNAAWPSSAAPVAPGSLVSAFGGNLGIGATAGAFPLPAWLGGTSVRISGNYAAVLFAATSQINFQVPWEAAGTATSSMSVTAAGVAGAAVPINLQTYAPGIFTITQSGAGQGAIVINSTGELAAPAGSVPGLASRPARAGEVVSIYCTGLGPVTHRPLTGDPAPADPPAETTTTPVVLIGGVPAAVVFSGLAPGTVGFYQVNVIVPSGFQAGDSVPITLTIGDVKSNVVGMAVQ